MKSLYKYLITLACVAPLSACASHPCHVVMHAGEPTGISVSGSGEVEGQPDVAIATLGVEVRSASAKAATDLLATQMTQVVDALKKAGIVAADIQTAQLSVYMEYMPPPEPVRDPVKGGEAKAEPVPQHRATNTVTVKIRDLNKASDIVTAALAAGANTLQGIQFDIEDTHALVEKARQKSMSEAKTSAEALAKLAGVTLGAVRQISENSSYNHPMMASMRAPASDASAKMMPVERGTMTVSHNVQVTYEIETN